MLTVSLLFATLFVFLVAKAIESRFKRGLRSIPGPILASFSDLWRTKIVFLADMPRQCRKTHERYGPVVRTGPNHVSFASKNALEIIHRSKDAFAKSDFYAPTSPWFEGRQLFHLFSIQDIDYHASFKRNIGSLYTPSAVRSFEPQIDRCLLVFITQLKNQCLTGPTKLDMSLWLHLFAFDCLGELNVSRRFGFLETGKDVQGMIAKADHILHMTGLYAQNSLLLSWQKFVKRVYGMRNNPVLLFTFSCIEERRRNRTDSDDMLNRFLKLQESDPDKLSTRELAGSLYINIMAGHDVLAITLRAILYYLARSSRSMRRFQEELSQLKGSSVDSIAPYSEIMRLPYLDAIIHEALRRHPNTGLILERVVPPGGAVIDGYSLPSGTIVGVNAWSIHFDHEIYGDDVDQFRPERWLEASDSKLSEMKRNLFSFGAGPRGCIGRHIAMLQMKKVVVEFYRHFEAKLAHPEKEWKVHGSWVTKQTEMDMIVEKRPQ